MRKLSNSAGFFPFIHSFNAQVCVEQLLFYTRAKQAVTGHYTRAEDTHRKQAAGRRQTLPLPAQNLQFGRGQTTTLKHSMVCRNIECNEQSTTQSHLTHQTTAKEVIIVTKMCTYLRNIQKIDMIFKCILRSILMTSF